jgi:hypothetical protein
MKKIKIDENHLIEVITLEDLFKEKVLCIPIFQRHIDDKHVNELVEFYKENINNINDGRILFGYLKTINEYHIIDGQHRLSAINRILNETRDYDKATIAITVKICNNMDELFDTYKQVNYNHPLDDFHKTIVENQQKLYKVGIWISIERNIYTCFKKYIKKKETCNPPNICVTDFMLRLKNMSYNDKSLIDIFNTDDEIINRLSIVNSMIYERLKEICETDNSSYVKNKMSGTLGKINKKSTGIPFCLGIDVDWSNLIFNTDYPILFAGYEYQKMSASRIKQIKNEVWEMYAPVDENTGKPMGYMNCFCCKGKNGRAFTRDSIECQMGHVVPKRYGGLFTSENLRPVCITCNNNMKTMNMFDYMKMKNY